MDGWLWRCFYDELMKAHYGIGPHDMGHGFHEFSFSSVQLRAQLVAPNHISATLFLASSL